MRAVDRTAVPPFPMEGRIAAIRSETMLKLYTAHNSICTQKVFLTLIEKGLEWQSEYIDLFKNEQYRPEYLRLNPKGVVPTLIHEGHAIVESTLICEYLDEIFPDP